jgi:hypothetical protein
MSPKGERVMEAALAVKAIPEAKAAINAILFIEVIIIADNYGLLC